MFLGSRVSTKVREATAPGSDLRHAPVNCEIHAGDERAFIGGEERDGSRDFLWLAAATHWDLCGVLGGRLLGLCSGKARVRYARSSRLAIPVFPRKQDPFEFSDRL